MDSSLFVDNSAFGELSRKFTENNRVNPAAFDKYSVKKGLRNPDGTGVMVGLTKICNVEGYYIEIQLRTISMDTWAALEHHLRYKKPHVGNQKLIVQELKRCADELASTDVSMQTIRDMLLAEES